MNPDLSTTANLIGDPGRAAILLSLMDGIALPAGELARIANVSPQTASGHLVKLVHGGFLKVESQGRHRYYQLAGAKIADAIEALLVVTPPRHVKKETIPDNASAGSLAYARTCYSHLAGWLGVQIAHALVERRLLLPSDAKTYTITPAGIAWFADLGVEASVSALDKPSTAVRCLDWTERRHHLAGALGCAMYRRLRELRWLAPISETRAVRVTLEGKNQLWRLLRIPTR